ncbi:MAG: hypothetical protein ACM3Q1_02825 [Bacteroidales bacterium]
MATKITQQTVCASSDNTAAGKSAAEPATKVETSEDLRRRRAGIACFL